MGNECGRWMRVLGKYADNGVIFKCSECGYVAKWTKGMKSLYPSDSCPKCHADMTSRRTAIADKQR